MNMNINYDAGLYCRLSRDDNNGNSESMSIANQKQQLVEYVRDMESGNTYYKYKCSRYANNGKTACTSHYIEHDVLLNAVWEDIKANAKLAAKDEEKLLNKLLSVYEREQMKETNNLKAKIIKADNRLVEIDNLIKSLFAEKSKGNVPDSIFKKMLIDYENEQNELNAGKMETERTLQDSGRSESSITQVVKFLFVGNIA